MNRVVVAVLAIGLLGGCSSIITYIRSDNSSGNAQCEPDSSSGGILSVQRDCIINQPAGDGNTRVSTTRPKA
ncbi:hypothetical protein ACW5WQ_21230 [Aeromonas rivuli]|uniref:hypothetical protein n=1 Tax=Aeromonas rivuli TaxID=648794 RepID=UPI0005AB29FB|nr:hypothetical protein [Aeromonas rivuli]